MSEFILGDCMKYMLEFDDNHFDLAIVDPPYGIKQNAHRENNRSKLAKSKKYHKALWDQSRPDAIYFKELFRISKNQIIWGANNYPEFLKSSPCWIVWDKNNTAGFADAELAYTSFKTAVRIFTFTWNGMQQGIGGNGAIVQGNKHLNEVRIHPTQKPVQLYKWLLKNYANPDDKILSTHVGSSSDLIAFEDFGCDYVGYEIDPQYFYAAQKRLEEHKAQLKIF